MIQKKLLGVLIAASLFGNSYLFSKLYIAKNEIDFISHDIYHKYVTKFQHLTINMDEVINNFENDVNYLWLISNSEYLRIHGHLPSDSMKELSYSLSSLGKQVDDTVVAYFYFNKEQSLSQQQKEYLRQFQSNLQLVSDQFDETFHLLRNSDRTLKDESKELAELIDHIVERNEEILSKIPPLE